VNAVCQSCARRRRPAPQRRQDPEQARPEFFSCFFSIVRAPQGSFLYLVAHKGENRSGIAINLNGRGAVFTLSKHRRFD
jgi:hypothetical protein